MKLEVVVVPVADADRAEDSCKALGSREDTGFAAGADFRVVQLTPPGSACSVIFGTGITSATPGSAESLHVAVTDIEAARAELIDRGADVGEAFHDAGGCSTTPGRKSYGSLPVQRPGPQRLAAAGDHHPPSGPVTRAPI